MQIPRKKTVHISTLSLSTLKERGQHPRDRGPELGVQMAFFITVYKNSRTVILEKNQLPTLNHYGAKAVPLSCLGAWISNTVSYVVQAVLVTQKPLMCWD